MADADDVLLSDSDEAPDLDPSPAAPAARKRGRPKGSTKAASLAAGRSGERLAGVSEMADVLSKLVGLLSVVLAFALVGQDYATEVALTKGEARDIAEPAARLIRKSRLARQFSTVVVQGSDYLSLAQALVAYVLRVYPVVAQIQAQKLAERGMTHGQPGGPQPAHSVVRPAGGVQAGANAGAQAPAPGAGDSGPIQSAPVVPFAGLTDADANQFAAWSNGNLGAALRAAAGN